MLFAGSLTEKLSFYKIVETQSQSGYKSTEEQFMYTCNAYRLKNKENYGVDAGEMFHSSELTFQMRFRKEIEETNIVEYEGKRYRITSLSKYPRENTLTLILAKIND